MIVRAWLLMSLLTLCLLNAAVQATPAVNPPCTPACSGACSGRSGPVGRWR